MTGLKNIFSPKEFTGWHMFGVLFLFFGTIVSVNMVLAFNAGSTWTGLVVKNTYVESQHFNERQAVVAKQQAMGWQHQITLSDGDFKVQLTDSFGKPIRDAIVTADIGRPVQEGDDRLVQLAGTDGQYSVETLLGRGLWRARIHVIGPLGEEWQRTFRFTVTEDGKLRLEDRL